jgi:hypothetical protein
LAAAVTLRACAAVPGASSTLPTNGPLFPAAATKSVPYRTDSRSSVEPTRSTSASVFSRPGRDSEPRLMFTTSAPIEQPVGDESAGIAAHSMAAIRSLFSPAPASVSTLPTASSASGATPAYFPSSVASGVPSPVPVAIPATCVPCPCASVLPTIGWQPPPLKFRASTTFRWLTRFDQ